MFWRLCPGFVIAGLILCLNDCVPLLVKMPDTDSLLLCIHPVSVTFCRYKREFGFVIPERTIIVDDIRVRGVGKTDIQMDVVLQKSGKEPRVEKVNTGSHTD